MKTILALDGGGIRGIIQARLLQYIEEKCGCPAHKLFDMIVGTSTGGILAVGLTTPDKKDNASPRYSAEQMADLYTEQGRRIFPDVLGGIPGTLHNILEEKYPSEGIDSVLKEYFDDAMLSQSLTDLLVPAYDIESRTAYFFKRYKAREEKEDFLIRDVARATSAAPTYFEPHKIKHAKAPNGEYFAFIDGGVFANNPALCALVEMLKETDGRIDDILLVSIGTGESIKPIQYEAAKRWGLAGWATQILGITFDGVADTVDYQLLKLLNRQSGKRAYYRFSPRLHDNEIALDNTRPANVHNLNTQAYDLLQQYQRDMAQVIEILSKRSS